MSTADRLPGSPSANASSSGSTVPDNSGTTSPITTSTANHPPTINGTAAATVVAGQNYTFAPLARDADDQTLFFFIDGKPGWASFDVASGVLTGTPAAADVGDYANVRISVTDGIETTSLQSFAIQVLVAPAPVAVNHAPTLAGTPPVWVQSGAPYLFDPVAHDEDGDSLVFSARNVPRWAHFDATTGELSGQPAAADNGDYANIELTVSDGLASAALPLFAIHVQLPAATQPMVANLAPKISGTPPASVTAGHHYAFTPTASDPEGDSLNFVIDNQPYWINFDAGTGAIVGAPSAGDVGQYADIRIGVDDGHQTSWLDPFSIRVTAAISGLTSTATTSTTTSTTSTATNHAPTLAGTPTTSVAVGSQYAFTPTSADADGDPLSFSIQNKPTWATFSSADGSLKGTPAASNVGTTYGVAISASDGKTSTSLGAFDLVVVSQASGTATLSWNAPTQNSDGSALTDLAGYRISYGSSIDQLHHTIHIKSAGVTTYVVTELDAGTWYFVVRAVNSKAAESDDSNTATKTIM